MIIKRKYETIGALVKNDPEARKVFENDIKGYSEDKKYVLNPDNPVIVYEADMGSGLRNKMEVIRQLDELDNAIPYDNGFTLGDATRVEMYKSRRGNAVELVFMYDGIFDVPDRRIVQVVALENVNGMPQIIPPWEF